MMLMKVFLLLSSELPQSFYVALLANIFYFVWYSEEITGLETWHLNPVFSIY